MNMVRNRTYPIVVPFCGQPNLHNRVLTIKVVYKKRNSMDNRGRIEGRDTRPAAPQFVAPPRGAGPPSSRCQAATATAKVAALPLPIGP